MYGYVYKTTNIVNGKIYVGQHKATEFKPRAYIGSGVIILSAIKKYGKDSFAVELLDTAESRQELNSKERYWIDRLRAREFDIGYNISRGGQGFEHSEESKRKIGVASRRRVVTAATRKKISTALTGRKGTPWTESRRELMISALTGRKKSQAEIQHLKDAYDKSKHKAFTHRTPVVCIETGQVFSTIKEAQATISRGDIQACCSGKQKTAGRLHWRYFNRT